LTLPPFPPVFAAALAKLVEELRELRVSYCPRPLDLSCRSLDIADAIERCVRLYPDGDDLVSLRMRLGEAEAGCRQGMRSRILAASSSAGGATYDRAHVEGAASLACLWMGEAVTMLENGYPEKATEHAAEALRVLLASKKPFAVSMGDRIVAMLRAVPRCPTKDLAHVIYGSSGPDDRNRLGALLRILAQQGRVRAVGRAQWEAREEDERRARPRTYKPRVRRAPRAREALRSHLAEVA
jgi:hypothetical protein